MTPVEAYLDITKQWLSERDKDTWTDEKEDQVLDQLDDLWYELSDYERDQVETELAKINPGSDSSSAVSDQ